MPRLPTTFLTVALLHAATPVADSRPARLPEVTITKTSQSENRPADGTGRPEWTSARRFSTTRVYIQKAPWEIGVEQWWRVRDKRDGTVEHKFQEEIELGLPYRMQLDIYLDWFADGDSRARYADTAFELRWALADWGKIPLNPALYAEYKIVDPAQGPDVYELKLLLGTEITRRLHWGLNVVYEQEIGGERATEWQISQGFSYSVIDSQLGIGVEMKYVDETARGARGDSERKFLIGPSVQWRPTPRMHIDLTALWGTNEDAQNFEGFVVIGYDFGKISGGSKYQPTSVRSN